MLAASRFGVSSRLAVPERRQRGAVSRLYPPSVAQPARPDAPLKSGRKRTEWWRERDETLTDIARSYNIKAYGVKEDAALPENSGTVFVR